MGTTLYFDCFSGASGDMILGALLDVGVPLEALHAALGSLAIDHGTVSAERVLRAGISATKFKVVAASRTEAALQHDRAHAHSHGGGRVHSHRDAHDSQVEARTGHAGREHGAGHDADHAHHSLVDVQRYVARSALSPAGKTRVMSLFHRLAETEAAIHDVPLDRIHLHEVGAIDSIVDIVGVVFAMESLGVDRVASSPVNVGSGTIRCTHGDFPVPAPATAALLKNVPIFARGVATELTTPTGALLLTEYAQSFGPMPAMRVQAIGYGAGDKDFPSQPNVLRVMLGQADEAPALERIITLECEIDDMNPQLFGPLMDRLYEAGALDVYYSSVQMKKNRPGTLVTVIAAPDRRDALAGVLFSETTTIGVRQQEMLRERLERKMVTIATACGPVRFKVSSRDGRIVNASPEFEDCARAAAERGLPIKEVQAQAISAWMERESK